MTPVGSLRAAAVASAVVLLTAAPGAQTPPQAVVIDAPGREAVVTGPVRLEARVLPDADGVQRLTFFVDGERICQAMQAPFACEWDAGRRAEPRTIRVVADLASGERLVATRRTRPRGLTFEASTDAVLVPVRVIDASGSFVRQLSADRFRLYEDGLPQQIATVTSEGTPAQVVLALDMSASMRPKLADLQRAAGMFLDAIRPVDEVAVAGFNEDLFVLTDRGATTDEQRAALGQLRPWGDTALYDALVRSATLLRTRPSPRAVVAFTDGADVSSRASVETVRSVLQAADVILYLVVGAEQPAAGSPLDRLARIAKETGGDAWFTPRMDALGDRFTAIVDDLSSGYVLTYLPDRPLDDNSWRTLRVEVDGLDGRHTIRARQGYLAAGRN